MAYGNVMLKHETRNDIKEAPVGFSWTVLFFGFFPTLFRSDWKWFLIILAAALLTLGLSNLVFMFIYNRLSLKDRLMNGYRITQISGTTPEALNAYLGLDTAPFLLQPA